jgi:hypothetical protein
MTSPWQDSRPTERQAGGSDFGRGPDTNPRMARRTGVLGSWRPNSAPTIREWPVFWPKPGLQPHRLRRYGAGGDPDFETKAARKLPKLPRSFLLRRCANEPTLVAANLLLAIFGKA